MASDDDKELFRRAMEQAGVVRQRYKNVPASRDRRPVPGTTRHQKTFDGYPADHPDPAPLPVPVAAAIDQTTDGYPVQFVRAGINKRLWKQFRSGKIAVEESIDLHGMRSHQASIALDRFLNECLGYNLQVIEIIHGKGRRSDQPGGVLGPLAIHFLKQQPEVIAFCSAPADGGGSGATRVLLKTQN